MRRKYAVCAVLVWSQIGSASCIAAQSSPWMELARSDLQLIHQTLLDHHPGSVDSLNPVFRAWLDTGYSRALAMTDSVRSLDGMIAVISYYTSGFQDGHLGWGPDFTRRTVDWPGVVLARRGGRYLVHYVAPGTKGGPNPGAEVLACAGVPIDERMRREVMAFEGGIPALEASRARLAPSLLVWDGNPWRTRPSSCRVRDAAGEHDVALTWQQIGIEDLDRIRTGAAFGETPTTYSITFPRAGIAWVTIPSFAENVGDHRAGLEDLIRRLPTVRESTFIVFDVRGNHGGNSFWGEQLLSALLGGDYVRALSSSVASGLYIQWRTSPDNANFIEQESMPRFEKSSQSYQYYANLVASIRDARAKGLELTPPPAAVRPRNSGPPPHPLGQKIVLLADGWCASACLDFADLILAVPGVRHAGAATYADAVYIDNRAIRPPSDLGWFGFSMKVYRGRPRGHNQPYLPTLVYPAATWSTPELQSWLIGALRPSP